MLENEYLNLYQSDYYKQQVAVLQDKKDVIGLRDFEQNMAIANLLYTESKKCIAFTSNNPEDKTTRMVFVRESETIKFILAQEEGILEILEEIRNVEEALHPTERVTQLDATISVCEKHKQNMQEEKGIRK